MQVREVICPSCSHRFMWMDVEEGPTNKKYRSVETGETFPLRQYALSAGNA